MSDNGPWLDEPQQRLWRGWIALASELPAALHRQLQADSGLSLQDFEILVRLTETEGGRARVTDLANAAGWERSRLSHHVKRMETRGLVQRQGCCDDGRGAFVVVTADGRDALERAAPGHARTVRELLFPDLDDAALASVTRFVEGALGRVAAGRSAGAGDPCSETIAGC
jgi:DNA-binding MarR family transcriptional regulator